MFSQKLNRSTDVQLAEADERARLSSGRSATAVGSGLRDATRNISYAWGGRSTSVFALRADQLLTAGLTLSSAKIMKIGNSS